MLRCSVSCQSRDSVPQANNSQRSVRLRAQFKRTENMHQRESRCEDAVLSSYYDFSLACNIITLMNKFNNSFYKSWVDSSNSIKLAGTHSRFSCYRDFKRFPIWRFIPVKIHHIKDCCLHSSFPVFHAIIPLDLCAAPVSQRSRVRIPYKPEFFSGFLFATAKVAYITAMIILHLMFTFSLFLPKKSVRYKWVLVSSTDTRSFS